MLYVNVFVKPFHIYCIHMCVNVYSTLAYGTVRKGYRRNSHRKKPYTCILLGVYKLLIIYMHIKAVQEYIGTNSQPHIHPQNYKVTARV